MRGSECLRGRKLAGAAGRQQHKQQEQEQEQESGLGLGLWSGVLEEWIVLARHSQAQTGPRRVPDRMGDLGLSDCWARGHLQPG